jgi:S1-C subfamily serine protease
VRQGDTSALGQGETLYAIGNPLKLDHSVTSGVFSGRREGMLQTNAQINPGNSGGPLINEQGQVIGINTMKLGGENIEGIGFAIPIEVAIEEFSDYLQ